ncbi:EamA-like transporter family protein [Candidatus Methanoplasma termitum]|uniref:EamA-like transporter family protein n=1 Tax=Candidatus Methanoplasma termitum TaxID=1577791 RepID=A0A0A7LG30_9ARCH|nr:DMT family transporter [Candidatus Methanoplasma termitum]AIZ57252.1 EamA-like transporter family protein [Candidatus Methanoplasma termitum]MCL2334341.1 DMT family transporter [Candidatus Methanoplasma sp.]
MLTPSEYLIFEKERLPYLSAFLTICMVWGLSLVVAYDLLDTGIPPIFLIAVTYGLGAVTLIPAKFAFRSVPKISRDEWRYGALVGAIIFLAFGLQTVGLLYTTPAKSGLLTVLYVLFVPIIIALIQKKISWLSVLFALIGFMGVLIMSGITGGDASMNIGDVLTIICAVMFAMQFVALEKYSPRLNAVNFTLVQMITAAAIGIAVSLVFENGQYNNMGLIGSWLGLVFMGFIVTGLGFYVQTAAQKKIPSTTIAIMCCTESVFAVIFSWALGYDIITIPLFVGAVLIVASTVLSSIYERRTLIS